MDVDKENLRIASGSADNKICVSSITSQVSVRKESCLLFEDSFAHHNFQQSCCNGKILMNLFKMKYESFFTEKIKTCP